MNNKNLCSPMDHSISRRQWLGGGAGTTSGSFGLCQPALAQDLRRRRMRVLLV